MYTHLLRVNGADLKVVLVRSLEDVLDWVVTNTAGDGFPRNLEGEVGYITFHFN